MYSKSTVCILLYSMYILRTAAYVLNCRYVPYLFRDIILINENGLITVRLPYSTIYVTTSCRRYVDSELYVLKDSLKQNIQASPFYHPDFVWPNTVCTYFRMNKPFKYAYLANILIEIALCFLKQI